MKNYILIGIVIAMFVVGGIYIYQNKPELQLETGQFQQDQEEKILDVLLEISAPFSIATLSVSNQGIISYEAEAPRAGIEKQVDSIKITEQEFNDLSDLITQNNFWSFDEKDYRDKNIMDLSEYVLTVILDEETAIVRCHEYGPKYYPYCPEEVIEIIEKVKSLWGKEILKVGV